jgi:hydroxyacylglutathione hydrolase
VRVLAVPGHTLGHIAYVRESVNESVNDTPGAHWLFCGDTLFGAGCGRLFEGTPEQMRSSLDALAALPDDTQVFCAHEYTLANLRFAQAVEPGNAALAERIERDTAKRAQGLPTIPSTIALEKATNPFLRYDQPAIAMELVSHGKLAANAGPDAIFTALRAWKNTF